MSFDLNAYKLFNEAGEVIERGSEIVSFRGESFEFVSISKAPGGGSGGKIVVKAIDPPSGFDGLQELYPSVFDCKIL